jgi:hypothetical protein
MNMSQSNLSHGAKTQPISGYDYGQKTVARSPVSIDELRQIEEATGWTDEDAKVLQHYGDLFRQHADEVVSSWRAVIGSQPHLAKSFFGPDGKPDENYKAKVGARFVQWVLDACFRPHNQEWLDYQEEIGLRHTPDKKNKTDGTETPAVVPLRYLIAFGAIVVESTRKFFVDAGVKGEDLQRLSDAWLRAVQLHITLWARPYAKEGLW